MVTTFDARTLIDKIIGGQPAYNIHYLNDSLTIVSFRFGSSQHGQPLRFVLIGFHVN